MLERQHQKGTRRLMKTSILRANNEEIHSDEHFKSSIKKGEHQYCQFYLKVISNRGLNVNVG